MTFQKYWHLKAVNGWCVSIPHTDVDLLEILDSITTLSVGVEVVSTSHGLYGDTMYLRFFGATLTKTKREKFLALVEDDCEFWQQKDISVDTLQRFGQAPLCQISVDGVWKYLTFKEAHLLYKADKIDTAHIGGYVLNHDLTMREISEHEVRLIRGTTTD